MSFISIQLFIRDELLAEYNYQKINTLLTNPQLLIT
jgi:hypothetical protein